MRFFTPGKNYYGAEPDGRAFVVAHKDRPIPYAEAERLGIIPQAGAAPEQLSEIEGRGRHRTVPAVATADGAAETPGAGDGASTAANAPQTLNAGAHEPSQGAGPEIKPAAEAKGRSKRQRAKGRSKGGEAPEGESAAVSAELRQREEAGA